MGQQQQLRLCVDAGALHGAGIESAADLDAAMRFAHPHQPGAADHGAGRIFDDKRHRPAEIAFLQHGRHGAVWLGKGGDIGKEQRRQPAIRRRRAQRRRILGAQGAQRRVAADQGRGLGPAHSSLPSCSLSTRSIFAAMR